MPLDGAPVSKRFAFSVAEFKAIDDEKRIITGMATTPAPDRVGDVVEPEGAVFKLPVPLLAQHDADKPIGFVTDARVSEKGIEITAQIAADDPALPEIARTWAQIKKKLVRGLSIGFQDIEAAYLKETGGVHFLRWEWLELSVVTIPAQQQATIQTVKAFDERQRGFAPAGRPVVRLASAPDVSGKAKAVDPGGISNRSEGAKAMATIQERISKWEAKRAANVAARSNILKAAEDDGDRTLTGEEQTEHDRLGLEIKEIDGHLVRLKDEAEIVKASATPVGRSAGTDPDAASAQRGGVRSNVSTILSPDSVSKEMIFVQHVKCELLARMEGGGRSALDIAKTYYPNEPRLQNVFAAERSMGMPMQKAALAFRQKANVTALNTTDAAGGGALAQYQIYSGDFVNWLRPQSIVGKFGMNGIPALRRVPFRVSIASQTSGGAAYWTGEGKPKPLTSFGFTRTNFDRYKIAAIAVVTEEQLRSSDPAADATLRDALRDVIIEREDRDFIDPDFAGSAGVSPASITYGATGTAASGTTNDSTTTDIQVLLKPMLQNNLNPGGVVLIMSAVTALALSLARDSLGNRRFPDMSVNGGTFAGLPVIMSQYADFGGGNSPATNGVIIAVNAPEIYFATDDGVEIAMSNQASLQMLDNPTNDSITPTATTMVSMFQTDSVAIRAELFVNWARRRPGAVQYLTGVNYNGLNS